MLRISIIIPTLNRYSDLKNTIKYLQNQDVQDFELIIIDQSQKDLFIDLSGLDSRIIHLHSEIKSASAARNRGLLLAKSEVVLFLDDDVIIKNTSFLKSHLHRYEIDETLAGVYGSVLESRVNQQPTLKRHSWSFNKDWGWLFFPQNYDGFEKINSGRSCNLSVRKLFALDVGGMDENYIKGAHREEADFCYRLTKKYGSLLFSPKARLIHIGNPTGGIRNWDINKRLVQAQHHFDGAVYFMLKNVPLKHFHAHLLSFFVFFFYRSEYKNKPHLFLIAAFRSLKAIKNAFSLLIKKPKYISHWP